MSASTNPSDIATLLPNVIVFIVAVIASVAGVYRALQQIKKPEAAEGNKAPSTFQAGVILDNVSITLWAESNRAVAESNQAVIRSNESLKAGVYSLKESLVELAHQIELSRAMERRR